MGSLFLYSGFHGKNRVSIPGGVFDRMAYHDGDVLHRHTGRLQAGGQRASVEFLRPAVSAGKHDRQGLALDTGSLPRFDGAIFRVGVLQSIALPDTHFRASSPRPRGFWRGGGCRKDPGHTHGHAAGG